MTDDEKSDLLTNLPELLHGAMLDGVSAGLHPGRDDFPFPNIEWHLDRLAVSSRTKTRILARLILEIENAMEEHRRDCPGPERGVR